MLGSALFSVGHNERFELQYPLKAPFDDLPDVTFLEILYPKNLFDENLDTQKGRGIPILFRAKMSSAWALIQITRQVVTSKNILFSDEEHTANHVECSSDSLLCVRGGHKSKQNPAQALITPWP